MYTAGPVVQYGEAVSLFGTAFSLAALDENRRRTLENTTHSAGFGKPAMERSGESEFGGGLVGPHAGSSTMSHLSPVEPLAKSPDPVIQKDELEQREEEDSKDLP